MTKAKDVHGVASAKILTGRTPPEEPEKCPTLEDIERLGSNLGVQWNEVPQEDRNGPLLSHVIVYKNCSMDKEKNVTVNISEAIDYYDFFNLGPGPYTFKVIARNTKGLCKGYQSTKRVSEERFKKPKLCVAPSPVPTVTTSVQVTSSQTTAQPTVTTSVQATSSQTTAQPQTTQQTQSLTPTPAASTQVASQSATLPPTTLTQEPQQTKTTEPTKEPCPTSTQKPCNCPSTEEPDSGTEKPAEKLSNADDNDWLKYVAIALAVIVVIMGITIFLLIWQLYKNHRFYKLRRDQAYRMTTQQGKDNPGQDNP